MKKISVILLLFFAPMVVLAEDCCTNHKGNSGTCSLESTVVCNDGFVCKNTPCMITTPLPSIEEKPKEEPKKGISKIYGCKDKSAKNYNKNATISDNSCIYYRYGCKDKDALNYDETAEKDDGSCIAKIYGCTDQNARNYNKNANINNHKCEYELIREVDEEIPYKVKVKKDKKMELGEEEIIQKGIIGRSKVKYRIILNGEGKEIEKKIIEKNILRKPQDKIIKEGNNDPIFDRTLLLYIIALFCIPFIYRKAKENDFYIISFILSISSTKGNIFLKIIFFLIYFFLVLPIFIDIFLLIKNEIEKRI